MTGFPIIRNTPVSPFVSVGVDNTLADQLASDWGRRNQGTWNLLEYMAWRPTGNLIDTIEIPLRVQMPRQVSFNGKRTMVTPGALSYQIAQKRFELTVGLNRVHKMVDGLADVMNNAELDVNSKAMQHLRVEAIKALVANPTRANLDNLSFFNASHPINPNQPGVVSQTTGLATQSNLFATTPLTHTNIMKTIQTISSWVDSSGMPIGPTDFTVFTTPSNAAGAAHWLFSENTGTNFTNGYTGSGNDVGQSTNPMTAWAQKRGYTLKAEVLTEYNGLSTDWFIGTGAGPIWVGKYMKEHTVTQVVDPTSEAALNNNMDLIILDAVFGIGLGDIWSIAKCTA